jgi:histidyl-tRNA synthetase
MTPTLARMVAAAERAYKKPIKWFAIPQLFRYERQQKGRLREHFQLNCDIFGEADPSADAELIALLIDVLRSLGLTAADFVIRLSSRNAWQEFFQKRSADPAREYDFYQAIDKMELEDPAVTKQKLAALGIEASDVVAFIEEAKPTAELAKILDNLNARGLREFVKIDYNVIRGLAYYTGPVFEAFDRKGQFRAIAGGGRYDHLVKLISGGKVNLAGLGFGMGDVVLTELLKERGLLPKTEYGPKAYCLIEDESLREASLNLVQNLRESRFAIEYSLTPAKSDKQFKRAIELNAAYTIKLERGEDGELGLRFKNLKTREEQLVDPSEAATHLRSSAE